MSAQFLARVVLGYTAAVEGTAALLRFRERTAAFKLATERAVALNRQLVVIGDPDAGFHTRLSRAYGCGDVCVDLNGCPKCPTTVVADITKSIPLPDDSSVVFVSCVLEYVTDLKGALREIARVAGRSDNVFIVRVQPWTLTARLYPAAHWRADGTSADMVPVSLEEKLLASAGLALVAGVAFWPQGRRR